MNSPHCSKYEYVAFWRCHPCASIQGQLVGQVPVVAKVPAAHLDAHLGHLHGEVGDRAEDGRVVKVEAVVRL